MQLPQRRIIILGMIASVASYRGSCLRASWCSTTVLAMDDPLPLWAREYEQHPEYAGHQLVWSDGLDYWIYRQGRWDMLWGSDKERIALLRLGFPPGLVP